MKSLFAHVAVRPLRPLIALLAVFAALTARAQVFSEDFGALANGTIVSGSTTAFNGVRIIGTSRLAITTEGAAGDGSSLVIQGASANSSIGLAAITKNGLSAFDVGTLSFSLFTPETNGTNGLSFFAALGAGIYFSGSSSASFTPAQATLGLRLNFDTSKLESYYDNGVGGANWHDLGVNALDYSTRYDLSIVFNGSASPVSYGGYSVGAGKADLWLDGSLVADDFGIHDSASVTGLAFKSQGTDGDALVVQLDDIALYNSALAPTPVPEPATYAALAGALALGLAIWRRRAG